MVDNYTNNSIVFPCVRSYLKCEVVISKLIRHDLWLVIDTNKCAVQFHNSRTQNHVLFSLSVLDTIRTKIIFSKVKSLCYNIGDFTNCQKCAGHARNRIILTPLEFYHAFFFWDIIYIYYILSNFLLPMLN